MSVKNVEQKIRDREKRCHEELKRCERERAMIAGLPDPCPVQQVHARGVHGDSGRLILSYEPELSTNEQRGLSVDDVLYWMGAAFRPVPVSMGKGTFRIFQPSEWFQSGDREAEACTEVQPIFPIVLNAEGRPGGTEVSLEWWSILDGIDNRPIRIKAVVEPSEWPVRPTARRVDYRGGYHYTERDIRSTGIFPHFWIDQRVKWWTPEHSIGQWTLYWKIWDEPKDPVQWIRDYIGLK